LRPDLRFVRTIQAPDQVVLNKSTGRYEISSAAFSASKSDASLSGDLEELLDGDGLDLIALFPAVNRAVAAFAFVVQDALDLGLTVNHEPMRVNWYHGGVRGNLKTRGIRQSLKERSREIVPIDQEAAARYHAEKIASVLAAVSHGSTV
jgi:hypothetical protein